MPRDTSNNHAQGPESPETGDTDAWVDNGWRDKDYLLWYMQALEAATNRKLTYRASGLLCHLAYTYLEDPIPSVRELMKDAVEGRDSLSHALNELRDAGLLVPVDTSKGGLFTPWKLAF